MGVGNGPLNQTTKGKNMAVPVYKLAEEMCVDVKDVQDFLNKKSHLNHVTEDEAASAKAHFAKTDGAGEVPAAPVSVKQPEPESQDKREIVRFMSLKRRHKIETLEGLIVFDTFRFPTVKGSKAYDYLMGCKGNPDLFILVGEPFESDAKRTEWRKIIEAQVLGAADEPMPDYGIDFLDALFNADEKPKLAEIMQRSIDEAIERVVRTKSYKLIGE